MGKEKISVIVPVYNIQSRLAKCLNSLIHQTYSNIEIVLVNDGSTDDSLSVCEDFAQTDDRIKIVNEDNHGLSFARNNGLDHATGNYVMFVDSDDYVSKTFCEDALDNAKQFGSDLVFFGYRRIENGKSTDNLLYGNYSGKLDKRQIMDKLFVDGYAWNKIYKRSLFDNIRYPVNQNFEDLPVSYRIVDKADKISYCAKVNYYYVASNGSIVSNMTPKNIADQFASALSFMDYLQDNYPNIHRKNISRLLETAIRYCTYCPKSFNQEYYRRAHDLLKNEPIPPDFNRSHKTIMALFKISAPLTKMLLFVRRKTNQ